MWSAMARLMGGSSSGTSSSARSWSSVSFANLVRRSTKVGRTPSTVRRSLMARRPTPPGWSRPSEHVIGLHRGRRLELGRDEHGVRGGKGDGGQRGQRRGRVDDREAVVIGQRREGVGERPCQGATLAWGGSARAAESRSLEGATSRPSLTSTVASPGAAGSRRRRPGRGPRTSSRRGGAGPREGRGRGPLGVEVDEQGPVAALGEGGAQVDDRGGLGDAALVDL